MARCGLSAFVLLGIEKLRIVPGITEANAYDLYYMPYTHSLPGALALSLLFGAIVAMLIGERRALAFVVISLPAFSHWVLDLLVHIPGLPLYDDGAKVVVACSHKPSARARIARGWRVDLRARRTGDERAPAHRSLGVCSAASSAASLRQFRTTTRFGLCDGEHGHGFYLVLTAIAAIVERVQLAA
jgi:hypothetical protein